MITVSLSQIVAILIGIVVTGVVLKLVHFSVTLKEMRQSKNFWAEQSDKKNRLIDDYMHQVKDLRDELSSIVEDNRGMRVQLNELRSELSKSKIAISEFKKTKKGQEEILASRAEEIEELQQKLDRHITEKMAIHRANESLHWTLENLRGRYQKQREAVKHYAATIRAMNATDPGTADAIMAPFPGLAKVYECDGSLSLCGNADCPVCEGAPF